jgi:dimethylhistidine N-methyltransferase
MRARVQREDRPSLIEFYDFHPKQEDFRSEILAGLQKPEKTLSPKFFYDERGMELFGEICELKEYYLTRAEMSLLKEKARAIAGFLEEDCVLIEYGCGNSEKIRLLLETASGCKAYAAVDIAKAALLQLAAGLAQSYPELPIILMCADFLTRFELPLNGFGSLKKVAFFPGSSIGNFDPPAAVAFLQTIAKEVGKRGALLIGVDLKKDESILHAAYNDAKGITSRFNKNILRRINRECGSDFDPSRFEHLAFYNALAGRIEMHLVSLEEQTVQLDGVPIRFKKGETIHTENSYKYHREEFQELARRGGWEPLQCWTDPQGLMSLHFLRVTK